MSSSPYTTTPTRRGLSPVSGTEPSGSPRRVRSEKEYREVVGRRVRLQRHWLRLGQQELAAAAGVSRSFVSAIERGAQGLDAWRLGLVADELGVPVAWLLDRIPGPITVPGPRSRPQT